MQRGGGPDDRNPFAVGAIEGAGHHGRGARHNAVERAGDGLRRHRGLEQVPGGARSRPYDGAQSGAGLSSADRIAGSVVVHFVLQTTQGGEWGEVVWT